MWKQIVIGVVVGAALVSACPTSADDVVPTGVARPRFPSPRVASNLYKVAHEAMKNHARGMQALLTSVLLLDDDTTARLAASISEHPAFSEDARHWLRESGMPSHFFDQEDVLRRRASALARAARDHDAASIAPAFGAVTETCVTCHLAAAGH